MLVELSVVEQRYQAVLEVLGGVTVVDVARRYGVARQTVHLWLRRYASRGLAGLVDRSSKPDTCPHQTPAEMEARIVEMRRAHRGWGPRTIGYYLEREGLMPVPSRSAIYRCLVRHGLVDRQHLEPPCAASVLDNDKRSANRRRTAILLVVAPAGGRSPVRQWHSPSSTDTPGDSAEC